MQQILITSLTAGLIAQLSKFFVKSNNVKFKWHYLWSYSGMPSSHAAITTALTTSVGLSQGIGSPLFAACLIFTLLIIRDAVGLRRYLGQHSEVLNDLVKELGTEQVISERYPRLREHIGHTPAQILAGCLVGLLISLIGYLL